MLVFFTLLVGTSEVLENCLYYTYVCRSTSMAQSMNFITAKKLTSENYSKRLALE